jgi:hypothetical protein
MVSEVLTLKDLNRATLARQMLLAREKVKPLQALERLVGLQAQLARPPFLSLWARLQDFRAEHLTKLAHDRKVVRATLMRGTLHLVSTKDYPVLRPLLQPMLSAGMHAVLGNRTAGLEIDPVVAAARAYLEKGPRTFEEVRAVLHEKWPKADERALGYAVRTHLPLVQVPTGDRWGWPSASSFAVAESWLGGRMASKSDASDVVLRYLAAFGPAGARDAETWLGMRPMKAAFEALRPRLRVFRDERGHELFDLPKAPRPSGDTAAPVRFLPDFDNVLLAHADRKRIVSDEHRKRLATANLRILPTFTVDGFVAGTWKIARTRAAATLVVEAFRPLSKKTQAELVEEGTALLRFAESDAKTTTVRFA